MNNDDSDEVIDSDLSISTGPPGLKETRRVEKSKLIDLIEKFETILTSPQANSKFKILLNILKSANEPFVVFAQSVDTVYEIKRFVEDNNIPCCLIVGGQKVVERRNSIQEFISEGPTGRRVLVSSSAGGEGINLQASRRLIHFDLPWNPMVLEQRIGRVHRIGSMDTVIVHTILLKGSREADIHDRLQKRLFGIVSALTDDKSKQAQLYRRIMAGIPLDELRELYGGEIQDPNEAIGKAVAKGKAHVDRVDRELQRNRITELPEDRGKATMDHLVDLLERSGKIVTSSESIFYKQITFDENADGFSSELKSATKYTIKHGRRISSNEWLVFDREAASISPKVSIEKSGGIDHQMVSLALRVIRTSSSIDNLKSLVLGIGQVDKGWLEYFGDGDEGPVVMLSYLTARLEGEHYFDHELHLYAVSENNPNIERLGRKEGDLVEQIIWENLKSPNKSLIVPTLSKKFIARLLKQDYKIQQDLDIMMKGNDDLWIGAVWPVAATILVSS